MALAPLGHFVLGTELCSVLLRGHVWSSLLSQSTIGGSEDEGAEGTREVGEGTGPSVRRHCPSANLTSGTKPVRAGLWTNTMDTQEGSRRSRRKLQFPPSQAPCLHTTAFSPRQRPSSGTAARQPNSFNTTRVEMETTSEEAAQGAHHTASPV